MTTQGPACETSQDKVEKTFELLAAAKKLESESSYWLATENFLEAHSLLTILAEEAGNSGSTAEKEDNDQQIAKLYASKADEYWKQSRVCLIKAMEQEKNYDEESVLNGEGDINDGNEVKSIKTRPCACTLLEDDEARSRNRSFSFLFSRSVAPVEHSVQPLAATDADCIPEGVPKQDDIEGRLRALNQSLPKEFKSMDDRMSDIHQGLGKLGLSYINTKPGQQSSAMRFDDELSMTEDEQIDRILAQAKDEVMIDKQDHGVSIDKVSDDEPSTSDDDSENSNSEEDLLLDNDQIIVKTIHKKVAKAQAKLSELLAFVDQAQLKMAQEEIDEENEIYKNNCDNDADSSEDDSFREVQKHDVAFLMMKGKKKLKSAQRDLKKVWTEWEDLIL